MRPCVAASDPVVESGETDGDVVMNILTEADDYLKAKAISLDYPMAGFRTIGERVENPRT